MPQGSLFCARCGAKLLTESSGSDTQGEETMPQPNPKQLYFQKLAKALTKDGFKIDPRLLEKSDAGRGLDGLAKVAVPISAYVLGPLGGLIGSLISPLVTLAAIGGEELYNTVEPIAPLCNMICAKYELGATCAC